MMTSLPNRDSTLQQQPANLVDHRGATYHPALTYPVQRPQIQLIVGLDRNETHTWSSHRLRDRLCIDVVVLIRLHVRFHILRRHQTHIMPLFPKGTAQKMGASTGLHADQGHAQIRCEAKNLVARALLAYHNFTAQVESNKMKDRLPKIDANRVNLHGTPPVHPLYLQKGSGGGPSQ